MNNPRCHVCGRFVSWSDDNGVYWGSVTHIEPPEPHYYCGYCAQEKYDQAVLRGYVYNSFWIQPNWQIQAELTLGLRCLNCKQKIGEPYKGSPHDHVCADCGQELPYR